MTAPTSPRLRFSRVVPDDAADLHRLATDAHVRRFLLDGKTVERAWADDEIARSDTLFAERGVGLWLLRLRSAAPGGGPIGFCGFRLFDDLDPDLPGLLYAFPAHHTGRGLATECAGALVDHARERAGLTTIVSGVDEPNAASIRVLAKLGFRETGSVPGAFGRTLLFELD